MSGQTDAQQSPVIILYTNVKCLNGIGMQSLIKIYHVLHELWPSYRDLLDLSFANLVIFLNTSVLTMLKCIGMQNLIKIYGVVQELWAFTLKDLDRPKWCLEKLRHNLHRWLDNAKLNSMQNLILIYHAFQRVMNIVIYWPLKAEMMLSKPSSIKKGCNTCSS